MANDTPIVNPTPDVTAAAPTAQPTTPDYTTQTQPAQVTPPQQSQQPQQPAAAQPAANAPMNGTASVMGGTQPPKVHGFLGRVAMGALSALADVGKATSVGQNIQNQNLARQQKRVEIQGQQQQQQLAQKQEQRAEQAAQQQQVKSLDEHQEAVLRTNGMSLDNMHKVIENQHQEALYPGIEQEQRNTLMEQKRTEDTSDRDLLSTLASVGIHIDTGHGAGHDNLTKDHAQAVASGKQTMLSNGKTGDEAGYGFVDNTMLQNTPLPHDVQVVSDYTLDSKTGQIKPVYSTLTAGNNTAFDALVMHDAASKKFQQLQTQYSDQLTNQGKISSSAKDAAEAAAQRAAADLNEAYVKQLGGGAGENAVPTQEVAQAVAALPQQVQTMLKQYDPGIQGLLIRGAAGWVDPNTFPERITKGGIGITRANAEAAMIGINPNWSSSLYKTIQNTQNQYINGKEGQSIRSFNQFLVHGAEALNVSDQLRRSNSPALNAPLNEVKSKYFGQPGVPELMTAVEAARNEWQSFIDSGYKPDAEQSKRASILMSDTSSPAQIIGVLGVMGNQAVGRLDQLNESYKTATGTDYPNLVTPSGREAANKLGLGSQIGQYKTGGAYNQGRGGPPQQPLTDLHINPQTNQTIGWNGSAWVDTKTQQPLQTQGQK